VNLVAVDTMLCVRDLARSIDFYRDVLGFEVAWQWDSIAALELVGHRVYVFTESPPTEDKPHVWLVPPSDAERTSVILVLRVEDCDAAYEELRSRGGTPLTPPATPSWGGRRFFLQDSDGYLIEIEQPPV